MTFPTLKLAAEQQELGSIEKREVSLDLHAKLGQLTLRRLFRQVRELIDAHEVDQQPAVHLVIRIGFQQVCDFRSPTAETPADVTSLAALILHWDVVGRHKVGRPPVLLDYLLRSR